MEFIISGTATYTTTLFPEGVDPTAQPTATLTTVIQVRNADGFLTSAAAGDQNAQDGAAQTTTPAQDGAAQTTTPAQDDAVQTTTPAQDNAAQTTTAQDSTTTDQQDTSSLTTDAPNDTTTLQGNQGASESTTSWTDAIDESAVSASAVSQPPAQVHSEQPAASTTTSTSSTETSATSTTSTAASETDSASSGSSKLGGNVPEAFTYSPYNSDGTCRSADDVYSDLQIIKAHGVSQVRIYGTDCNSLKTVQPACAELGIKINQGFWIGSAGVSSIDESIEAVIEYGQTNGWDIFQYITIGNEAIISGFCSVSDLISKIQSVKAQLKSAGYSGSVTTSEPPVTFENHPELCTSSGIDFVGVNPHSYFNSQIDAAGAGDFIKGQVDLIKDVCGTSNVVVTETGYPSQGMSNGKNVPSTENQKIAIESILSKLNNQVTILSYFNDQWKNPGPYGIEQSFGIQSLME